MSDRCSALTTYHVSMQQDWAGCGSRSPCAVVQAVPAWLCGEAACAPEPGPCGPAGNECIGDHLVLPVPAP